MKKRYIKNITAMILALFMLTGCSKEPANDYEEGIQNNEINAESQITEPTVSRKELAPGTETKSEKVCRTQDLPDEVFNEICDSTIHLFDYNDFNDEYNAKATPVEEFGYYLIDDKVTRGEIRVDEYKGTSDTVVIPSMIDGYIVTEVIFNYGNWETVKEATVPDTVTYMAGTAENLERLNYSGQLLNSDKELLIDSPYAEKIIEEYGYFFINNTVIRTRTDAESITFHEGITVLGDSAVHDHCPNLKEVNLPTTLKRINTNAIYLNSIETVNLNSKLEYVSNFVAPSSGDSVKWTSKYKDENGFYIFGNVLIHLPIDVYYTDTPVDVCVPSSVEYIAELAFSYSNIGTLTFENPDTKVHKHAFDKMTAENVIFPENLTHLNFEGIDWPIIWGSMTLPKNLKYLDSAYLKYLPMEVEIPSSLVAFNMHYHPESIKRDSRFPTTVECLRTTNKIMESGETYCYYRD